MHNFEFKEIAQRQVSETSSCEFMCPVIDADRLAAQTGNEFAQNDLNRHIKEAVSRGCTGTEYDDNLKSRMCPLFGVSVSF